MATKILTKKQFLEVVEASVDENQVVLMTVDLSTIEYKKKTNEKRVEFSFAADAWKRSEDIGHFHYDDKNCLVAFCTCNKKDLSEGALKVFKKVNPE